MKNGRVKVAWKTITPEMAEKMVEKVRNVRTTRHDHIAGLARAMKAKRWEANGATICIDSEGYVVDGEHRLRACMLAGVPFGTLVVDGIEQCDTIDTGRKPRTVAQLLSHAGVKNATVSASIARYLLVFKQHGGFHNNPSSMIFMPAELKRVAEATQHLDEAAHMTSRLIAHVSIPCGPLGFLACRAMSHGRKDELSLFFLELESGEGLKRGDPAYALREKFIGLRGKKLPPKMAMGMIFKSWNAYMRGQKIQALKFGTDEAIENPIF